MHCRCAVVEAWIWRFLLLRGCFCTALGARSREPLPSDLGAVKQTLTGSSVEYSIIAEIRDDDAHSMVVPNSRVLWLAAQGKNFESYSKNLESAVASAKERSAGKGSSSSSSLTESDIKDGQGMGPAPMPRKQFCPPEWMPMVADNGMQVGKGQYGVVYIANVSCEDNNVTTNVTTTLTTRMAFKVQIDKSKDLDELEEHKAMWLAEANLGMLLDNPYVMKVFDLGKLANGMGVMALEAVNGGDLESYFGGPDYATVDHKEVAEFTLQILWGLKYMHENDYVHADLKPPQVLLQCDSPSACEVRIGDLGLAVKATKEHPFQGVRGTPLYLAPEVLEQKMYPASDMWALGMTIHELLNHGKKAGSPVQNLYQLRTKLAACILAGVRDGNSSIYSNTERNSSFVNATARDRLLNGLLKNNPHNRIDAESAISLAQEWAEAEGVDQMKIDAIMLKGNETSGAKLPACWQKRKDKSIAFSERPPFLFSLLVFFLIFQ